MDAFSGGFVLGCVFSLVLASATLAACVYAASTESLDDFDTAGD